MRVLVLPHSMEIGGSQLNAVELAAGVRDRGHDVWVYAEEGPLRGRVRELGLTQLPRRPSRFTPGLEVALDLRRVVRTLGIDVVHGYEWPPILEAYAATWARSGGAVCVGTVMSMAVAPFLPSSVPLAVGTEEIRRGVAPRRRGRVDLIEPPVDTEANRPGPGFEPPGHLAPSAGTARVVVVSRLADELKLEGILTAVRAVGALASRYRCELLVVGDGPARARVEAEAAVVNRRCGRRVVLVAGEWTDPRWAYGSADICLGMGGSALRALAFGKPLVVQGEGGFFELLTPETVGRFLVHGWFGTDTLDAATAEERLVVQLVALLEDRDLRRRLGDYGRQLVVSRFSLEAAAKQQEGIYVRALADRDRSSLRLVDGGRAGVGLVGHKVRRRVARSRGTMAVDDFNAVRARIR